MIWDGETIYVSQSFRPDTKPSIKWNPVSNGNRRGSDRGIAEDVYESAVLFRGTLAELTTLETVLNDNRNELEITCGTGEELFGMDLDYSGALSVSVTNYGIIPKVGFKMFEMALKLELVDTPSFIGSAAITQLRKASHQDRRNSKYDIKRNWTYDRVLFSVDHDSSAKQGEGIYTANFSQTNEEMKSIRRYLLTTARAKNIDMPDFDNMDYPFGTVAGTGPFTVKVIKWSDGGRIDPNEWKLSITFSRVF